MSDKIKQCREQIDCIDDELIKLFNQRAALAQQIGHVMEKARYCARSARRRYCNA